MSSIRGSRLLLRRGYQTGGRAEGRGTRLRTYALRLAVARLDHRRLTLRTRCVDVARLQLRCSGPENSPKEPPSIWPRSHSVPGVIVGHTWHRSRGQRRPWARSAPSLSPEVHGSVGVSSDARPSQPKRGNASRCQPRTEKFTWRGCWRRSLGKKSHCESLPAPQHIPSVLKCARWAAMIIFWTVFSRDYRWVSVSRS
jgi:hypothetical protein